MMHQKPIKPLLYSWGLFFALFLSVLSCKRALNPEDQLPPETQTGANTFGCLIDGEPWVPNGGGGFSQIPPISGGYVNFLNTTSLNPKNCVWIGTSKNDRTNLDIYVINVHEPGRYPLNFDTNTELNLPSTRNFALYSIDGRTINNSDYKYITTSRHVGYVDFTVADTLTKQLSGTFEFEAIDQLSGKTIKITKGRFDVNQTTR